jgi:hypothetical protein
MASIPEHQDVIEVDCSPEQQPSLPYPSSPFIFEDRMQMIEFNLNLDEKQKASSETR